MMSGDVEAQKISKFANPSECALLSRGWSASLDSAAPVPGNTSPSISSPHDGTQQLPTYGGGRRPEACRPGALHPRRWTPKTSGLLHHTQALLIA